jgi:hypothetical protein
MALVEVRCPSCKKVHAFDALVPFRAECDACTADLHVCIACRFYDRYVENECREDQADPVANKDRRNLCEYFKPQAVGGGADTAAADAKAKLAAAFGLKPTAPSSTAPASTAPTAGGDDDKAAEAKRKLEALFGKK